MEERPIAECRLDLPGLRAQAERYRRLGRSATRVERSEGQLTVEFARDVDEPLLRRTIAVERTCCPFFAMHYDPAFQRLRITVADQEQAPALDALLFALSRDDD